MSSRAQVLSNNTTSFPNNNSGQITPQVLRDFNSDFINSVRFSDEPVVQATSASFASTAISASHALVANSVTGLVSSASFAFTASLANNALLLGGLDNTSFVGTGSFNSYSASMSTRITNQENFSSSLDATFATDAQLAAATASLSASIAAFYLPTSGTGSLLLTASFNNGTRDLTFTKGNSTTFTINIPDATVDSGSFVTTSSFNSFSGSISSRVTSLEQFSSSLDATFATDAQLNAVTASLNALSSSYIATSGSVNQLLAFSSSLDATFATDAELNAYTSSNNARVQALETATGSLQTQINSLANATSSYALSSTLNAYTSSNDARVQSLENKTGSLQTQIDSLASATASYVTNSQTGSFARTNVNNTFTGTQAFNNITVSGTASIQSLITVSGSAVIIGDEFIVLNANPPAARYAGIQIYDTGSASTASFEWDGVNDNWIVVEETGLSAGILTGPTGSKGSEVFPTNNTILKGSGHHTVSNSNITDDGSVVKINSNTEITGSLGVTGTITGTVTNAVTASFALLAATASFYGGSVVSASYALSASRAENSGLLNNFSSSQFALKTATNTFTGTNNFTTTTNFNASSPLQGTNGALQFGFYLTDTLFFVSGSTREVGFTNDLVKVGAANASPNTAGIYVSNAALSYFTAIEFPNGANYDGTVRIKMPTQITGSLRVTGGITGSLLGTAATASATPNAIVTASFATQTLTFTKGDGTTFGILIPDVSGSVIDTGSFATTGSNTFNGNQIISGSLSMSGGVITADATLGINTDYITSISGDINLLPVAPVGKVIVNGPLDVLGNQTITTPNYLQVTDIRSEFGTQLVIDGIDNGIKIKGGAANTIENPTIMSGSLTMGNGAAIISDPISGIEADYIQALQTGGVGYITIASPTDFTAGITGSLQGTASFATTASYALNAISASHALTSVSASSALTSVSASFAVLAGSAISATTAATASSVSALNQTLILSGSVRGEVRALTISSNTASLDCSLDNFFTLQLVGPGNTNINPTNIAPGQTINVLLSTTGSGTVSFPSSVKQASGSAYVPTTTTSKDILTFISFDGSAIYLANVKNLI